MQIRISDGFVAQPIVYQSIEKISVWQRITTRRSSLL